MGGFVLFARYARSLVVIVVDEGNVCDEAVTVVVAVFWTTEDDVWTSTSLFSVSTATADVFEGCFWWEIWWWCGCG